MFYPEPKTEIRRGEDGVRGIFHKETGERIFKTFEQATEKQKRWLLFFLQSGEGIESVLRAYPNVTSRKVAGEMHSRLKMLFSKAIEQEFVRQGWTPDRVVKKLGDLAEEAMSESVQLGATTQIGKHFGMFIDRKSIEKSPENYDRMTDEELLKEAGDLQKTLDKKKLKKTINEVEEKFEGKKEEKKVEQPDTGNAGN